MQERGFGGSGLGADREGGEESSPPALYVGEGERLCWTLCIPLDLDLFLYFKHLAERDMLNGNSH